MSDKDEAELGRIWSRITKGSGSIDIVELKTADDRRQWAGYVTKCMHRPGHENILAADFHHNDRVIECPTLRKVLDQLTA